MVISSWTGSPVESEGEPVPNPTSMIAAAPAAMVPALPPPTGCTGLLVSQRAEHCGSYRPASWTDGGDDRGQYHDDDEHDHGFDGKDEPRREGGRGARLQHRHRDQTAGADTDQGCGTGEESRLDEHPSHRLTAAEPDRP